MMVGLPSNDGAVDQSSVDREIRKSDAAVHYL